MFAHARISKTPSNGKCKNGDKKVLHGETTSGIIYFSHSLDTRVWRCLPDSMVLHVTKTTIVIFYTMRTSNLTYYGKFPPKIYWINLYLVHYVRYFIRSSNQTLSVIWKTKTYGTKKCTRPEINVFAKTLSLSLCLRTLRKTMDIHCSAHH